MDTRRRLLWGFALLAGVIVLGTAGYLALTGEPLWKCLFMTANVITTMGVADVLHVSGQPGLAVFTVVLLFLGLGVLLYTVSTATAFVVEGDLTRALRRRGMEKRVAKLSGHYVICGAGETGTRAIAELATTGRQVVAIERDPQRVARLAKALPDVPCLEGDASEDEVLLAAGIRQAAGLIAALPDDRDNVFVTLSARRLAPKLRIVARAVEARTLAKLRSAGADEAVSPNQIGGLRMASVLTHPGVVTFLDTMLRGAAPAVRFEELRINEGSPLAGRTLAEANLPKEADVLVVAVRKPGETGFQYGPPASTRLDAGLTLVVLGRSEDVLAVQKRHGLAPPPPRGGDARTGESQVFRT